MRWLATLVVVSALMSPTAASGYTFGDWASDHGYDPSIPMPGTVNAQSSSPPIDSLNGIGEYDWITIPTTRLQLNSNQISSFESGAFNGLANLTTLYLRENQISSIESGDFSGLANLTSLDLQSNQLLSIESGDFDGLPNLEKLFLQSNQLSSIESGDFDGLPNLERLFLDDNQLSSIESRAFSGLPNLEYLELPGNTALTELNLAKADFSRLGVFDVSGNVNITSVSLNSAVVNQTSLVALLEGGSWWIGIGELDDITEMDLSGIDFGNIAYLGPLYVMDDLTDLWLVDTVNLDASDLDVLLNELETIQGTATEGILHMTQANYDDFGPLLAAWHGEDGHHVDFVVQPGDFDEDVLRHEHKSPR